MEGDVVVDDESKFSALEESSPPVADPVRDVFDSSESKERSVSFSVPPRRSTRTRKPPKRLSSERLGYQIELGLFEALNAVDLAPGRPQTPLT